MDNKRIQLYGTPLSKHLQESRDDDLGPINARRARLNYQQTARDEQGKRRFHGAFTGGFNAGYYNTVDSAEGFRPASFISHRSSRQDGGSKFNHKPEDYMDDEDFGEFGIAPKKIRVSTNYSSDANRLFTGTNRDTNLALRSILDQDVSIGEKILSRLSSQRSRISHNSKKDRTDVHLKNDFHGIGYKGLLQGRKITYKDVNNKLLNPLKATLQKGKKLEISGSAFGSGVLEDEDGDFVDETITHGYDDISNYDFQPMSKSKHPQKPEKSSDYDATAIDRYQLPGFVPAKNLESVTDCDNIERKYPPPHVESHWIMPTRVLVVDHVPTTTLIKQSGVDKFNKKFTNSSHVVKSDDVTERVGLVLYSDLKAESSLSITERPGSPEGVDNVASISRQVFEWRPCSLLCKHFDVPNPFPDNKFCGVRPNDLVDQDVSATQAEEVLTGVDKLAPMELRRSIFNISDRHETNEVDSIEVSDIDSDDEPQIVESTEYRSDLEEDIIEVVEPPKQEPEVIVLSSSSESSSSSGSSRRSRGRKSRAVEDDKDIDLDNQYGPPLPPTRKALIEADRRRHHKSSKHKKKKKKKKHKKSRR